MIYIAAPYSHPEEAIRNYRLLSVAQYAQRLLEKGKVPFSPVLHCEQIERLCNVPGDFNFWQDYCVAMLKRSDELHVLMLDGWNTSNGVQAEMELAFNEKICTSLVKW